MFSIAHTAHWALGLLEATPVAIAIVIIGWKVWTDRRAAAAMNSADAEGSHA